MNLYNILTFFSFILILCLVLFLGLYGINADNRQDDNPIIMNRRIKIYRNNINQVRSYYKELIIDIDNKGKIDDVENNIKNIILRNGKPKKIIIIGSPGSGKSTFGKKIAKFLNVQYISTGDILRNEIKNDTELGKFVKNNVDNGKLVSSNIIYKILSEKISPETIKKGWILDGSPRNTNDIPVLKKIGFNPDIVIHLSLPDNKIMSRMYKRIQENLNSYNDVTPEKLVNCEGCLDEEARCHQGTVAQCKNVETNLCYAFYDENGNQRTPCGAFDRSKNSELSCTGCQQYCQWCIDKNGEGTCIGREIFNCDLCPNSRLCKENAFDIYIKKGD